MDPAQAPRVSSIDWSRWVPKDRATLLFVRSGDELLLIRKKRGLGAGKINAPGGRIEPGETPEEGALRETREEVGVEVTHPTELGTLAFQFRDGYSIFAHVFIVEGCRGEPRETEEAIPRWVSIDAIPWDEMWADDRLWVPYLLKNQLFFGRFIFDGDTMIDHVLNAGKDPEISATY